MTRLAPSVLILLVPLAACNEAGPTAPEPEEALAPAAYSGGLSYPGFSIPAPTLSTTTTFPGGGTGSLILDHSTTIVTLDILESATILDVNVALSLEHSFDADLTVRLQSPAGTIVVLSAKNGGDGDGYLGTYFDDEATDPVVGGSAPFDGPPQPQEALAALDGEDQQGTWILSIEDDTSGDTGRLTSWALDIEVDGPDDDGDGDGAPATLVIGGVDSGVADQTLGEGKGAPKGRRTKATSRPAWPSSPRHGPRPA